MRSDSPPVDADCTRALTDELETLRTHLEELTDRVDALEAENARLEAENTTLQTENEELRTRIDALEAETDRLDSKTTAAINRSGATKARLEELQARELEKGAHLLADNVDRHELELEADHLEKIRKDDRAYYRLPDSEDPLNRGGAPTLSQADLLPIQQLARMDEDMLRSTTSSLPSRLAAALWKARADPTVGDDPWKKGCKGVRAYVKASDLKHWIRRQEPGTSETYAKKLVSRTIDALLDLSTNRLAIRKKRERKNGLEYTERRVVLTTDAEIPGETSTRTTSSERSPKTADVSG